jgi:hypothetical protein
MFRVRVRVRVGIGFEDKVGLDSCHCMYTNLISNPN